MAEAQIDVLLRGSGSQAVQPAPIQVFAAAYSAVPTIRIGAEAKPALLTGLTTTVPFPSVNGSGALYPSTALYPAVSLYPQS